MKGGHALAGVLLLLLSHYEFACAASSPEDLDLKTIALHLDYRGGGDAPIGFLLTFFDDGRLRFYSARRKIYWSRLSLSEGEQLSFLLSSPGFSEGLASLKAISYQFACCDLEEVGIYLHADDSPIGLRVDRIAAAPPAIKDMIGWVNRIGKTHFGRKYNPQLPEL